MPDFTWTGWLLLALAAFAVGASKSGMPAFGTIPAALFATVLPAKASTGAVLGLLLVGDLIAVRMYHASADWAILRRLIPSVVVGVLLGVVALVFADDVAVRRGIGAILVVLVILRIALMLRARAGGSATGSATGMRRAAGAGSGAAGHPGRGWLAWVFGPLGGFTTMVANAAGPVMTLYFTASRLPIPAILGTAAWFFLLVNAFKVPFSIGLGLMTPQSLLLDLVLVPVLIGGAFVGRGLARRLSPAWFERIVLALTLAAGLYLLISA